jgi:colanic acid/amylovoran biosynthesis glycosyltransferase
MRVAYVMTHHPRVATSFITDEVRGLSALGCEVEVFAINPPDEVEKSSEAARRIISETTYLKSVGVFGLAWSVLRLMRRHPVGFIRVAREAVSSAGSDPARVVRRLAHVAMAAHVVERCRVAGISHVHGQFGLAPASIAWFAAALGNLAPRERWTWSFTIHGFHDFVDQAEARLDLKGSAADLVVCVSDHTRAQLCRLTEPEHWDRFRVVRCGIDLDTFARRAPRRTAGPPVIVTVARLSAEKGHLVLLEAVEGLGRSGIPVSVRIVGSGPAERLIRTEIARRGLDSCVDLLGERRHDEVAQLLADADVFCLPSFAEGLPVSIMEAMAIGVPVVCTGVNGVPELAVNDLTALTVAPGNAEELRAALARMLTEPGLGDRLARNADLLVKERHDLYANTAALYDLFASMEAHE